MGLYGIVWDYMGLYGIIWDYIISQSLVGGLEHVLFFHLLGIITTRLIDHH